MQKTIDVLCIGQAVIDCITRGQEADRHRENVYRADRIELHIGGDAVNESVALASMGYRAAIACGAGTDLAGNLLRGELARRGVDISRVEWMPQLVTPIAQLVVHQDGGRHSINSRATMLEGYLPVPESLRLQEARIVSLASLFRAPLDRAQTVRQIVTAAKQTGAIITADTKLPTFREIRMEELADVWPMIDYIFPNEKEASYYTGLQITEGKEEAFWKMTEQFRKYGVKNVVIKAGADGCYVHGGDADGSAVKIHLPALPVDVVDSTGAGDNFVAGFLSGILQGKDLQTCALSGRERAAASITRMGAN
ncbi:MAG: carbohydrate kinase family protein [Eubacteriales bacterium]|nr:carbohydrate kinase family protein [Eubacteriales bacterium]